MNQRSMYPNSTNPLSEAMDEHYDREGVTHHETEEEKEPLLSHPMPQRDDRTEEQKQKALGRYLVRRFMFAVYELDPYIAEWLREHDAKTT